jgi:hypothetical protein
MKFRELRIWDLLPTEPNRDPFFITEEFPHQIRLNQLFAKLDQLDDPSTDENTKNENLRTDAEKIIEECNSIINQHTLQPSSTHSNTIIAALHAAKMEIHLRLQNEERITSEYNSLVKASMNLIHAVHELSEDAQESIISTIAFIGHRVTKYLNPVITAKEDSDITTMSVPDILAMKSFVSNNKFNPNQYNLNDIRKTFHQLWQIKHLQPLLTFAAYSALGYHQNQEGEITESAEELKIIFLNDRITRQNSPDFGGMCIGKNMIFVSMGEDNERFKIRSTRYGSITIHELHHYWEESFNQSIRLLPYKQPKQNIVQRFLLPDPNLKEKKRLDKMLAEARSIKSSPSETIAHAIFNGVERTSPQPKSTFLNLQQYPKIDHIQRSEIVVRISESLTDLCLSGKYTEEQALKMLRDSGLNECVDFFLEEQEQMKQFCQKMQQSSGIVFDTDTKPFSFVPSYIEYESTPLHEAVAKGEIEEIRKILREERNCLQKDSLNQTALDLAILIQNDNAVIEFFRLERWENIWRELEQDPYSLRKAIYHIVGIAKNDQSDLASEALAIFKAAKDLRYTTNGNQIGAMFSEAASSALDINLQTLLKGFTKADEVLSAIEKGEINRFDKFGNELSFYVMKSNLNNEEKDKIREAVISKYDFFYDQHVVEFLPKNPLRKIISRNQPDRFIEDLQRKESPIEALKEKLGITAGSTANDSTIELVAMNCNNETRSGRQWFEVLKTIIRDYQINPHQKFGSNDATLLDLLPYSLREEMKKMTPIEKPKSTPDLKGDLKTTMSQLKTGSSFQEPTSYL